MTVVPMYMSEISPQKLAGSMGTLFCSGVCFGVFLSQFLGLDYLLGKVFRILMFIVFNLETIRVWV